MRAPKVTQSQLFDDIGRVFNGPKIIDIKLSDRFYFAICFGNMQRFDEGYVRKTQNKQKQTNKNKNIYQDNS